LTRSQQQQPTNVDQMPIEIKNKRTGEFQANGVVGNTIRCGHCNYPIVDDTRWFALDDPFFCLVHETCLTLFDFNNKMSRLNLSMGRTAAVKAMDKDVVTLQQMITRPWWQNRGVPLAYQQALQHLLAVHVSLRTAKVIVDDDAAPLVMTREQLVDACAKVTLE